MALACICLALVFAAVTPSAQAERDYAAETKAILDRRGESNRIVDCVLGTDQYDLSAGPMTDVALNQLLESCRAEIQETAEPPAPVETEDEALSSSAAPDLLGNRTETLQAGLSDSGGSELGRLRELCAAGSGIDCDRLFVLSAPDSDDEAFGLSCGDRPAVLDCADLVLETSPEVTG